MDVLNRAAMWVAIIGTVLLCGAVIVRAIATYRRHGDLKTLLLGLIATVAALCSGAAMLLIAFSFAVMSEQGRHAVGFGHAFFAYVVPLIAIVAGLPGAWALSVWSAGTRRSAGLDAPITTARGLMLFVVAACILAMLNVGGGLVQYGHDHTIAFPGLCALLLFLGLIACFAIHFIANDRDTDRRLTSKYIGATVDLAALFALGAYIVALAIYTLTTGPLALLQAWNVLILFYPVYVIASFAAGGAVFFFGSRLAARTWSSLAAA